MYKYPLIGGSICAVMLLVLTSLTNVVGYQIVMVSNQKIINGDANQKELLFQTIVDIANNKEIQRVILGSEITNKQFLVPGVRFSPFKIPVITERFLKGMYTMGAILFRTLDKSRIQVLGEHIPFMSQGLQKKLSAVIAKDATLKSEVTQLSNLKCDCDNKSAYGWGFPILCTILLCIYGFSGILWFVTYAISTVIRLIGIISLIAFAISIIAYVIAGFLFCSWIPSNPYFVKG